MPRSRNIPLRWRHRSACSSQDRNFLEPDRLAPCPARQQGRRLQSTGLSTQNNARFIVPSPWPFGPFVVDAHSRLLQQPALHRDPMHQTARAMIIVDRIVPGRPIVPEGDRAFAPLEARLEFRPCGMLVERREGRAFLRGPALEMGRESRIDVESSCRFRDGAARRDGPRPARRFPYCRDGRRRPSHRPRPRRTRAGSNARAHRTERLLQPSDKTSYARFMQANIVSPRAAFRGTSRMEPSAGTWS